MNRSRFLRTALMKKVTVSIFSIIVFTNITIIIITTIIITITITITISIPTNTTPPNKTPLLRPTQQKGQTEDGRKDMEEDDKTN